MRFITDCRALTRPGLSFLLRFMSSPRAMMSYDYPHPVSRTYQYKKITKPLLERKRRARINRCLDELKDLMVDAFETEGENISKLEKADILELTVRHLQKLQASRPVAAGDEDATSAESRWQSGFGHCATEACRFLSSLPGEAAERLARHLAAGLQTSRHTNSSPKASNLLSPPVLANLDRIASVVAPCSVGTSGEIENSALLSATSTSPIRCTPRADKSTGEIVSGRVSVTMLVNDDDDDDSDDAAKSAATCSARAAPRRDRRTTTTTTAATMTARNKSNEPQDIADDDEEIDVEHVDERDPMWRPW